MTILECWRPIPGHDGRYEVSTRGRVCTIAHTVTRSDGSVYPVQARLRRICVHRPKGLEYLKLATGQRGRYKTVWLRRLVAEVFGTDTEAAA